MVCRDEVVDWFHKLNGAGRLDVMCTLLDSCLPFELRFLGTYMENLGRKDFHQLRDADYRANSFLQHHQSRQAHSDRTALFNLLMDHATLSASQLSSPSGGAPAPGKGHPQSQDEVDAFSTTSLKNGLESVLMNGERLPEGKEVNGVNSSSSGESVDKGGGDKTVLEDEVLRRRLILFLSLLTATNRDCANAYFKILSEVLPLLDETGWLDNIEEMMLEEMAVLYTIAGNHPAFTFDQRKKLNEVGLIFRDRQAAKQQQAQLSHIITTTATKPAPPMMMTTATVTTTGAGGQQQQQLYPIHINEQQHYYLGPQQIPISMWQRAPTNPGGAYTSDDLARLQASAQYAFHTFPYTTSLPAAVFMAPQSHHPIAFPVQNRTPNNNNNSNNPLSTPSLLHEYRQQNYPQMIHAHNLGIHAAAVAASAAGGLSVLPAQFSQQQQQQQKSHHHNNDVIITPNGLPPTTTTTSVNQTDGNDSEELSWNSPELSPPFQSPSQSLTPSRSQSPIINKPLIQVQQQQQIQQQQQQQQLQQQQQQQQQQLQQQQQQQAPRQNYLPQVVSYTSQSSSEMAPPRSPPPPARPLKSNPNSPGGAIHTNGIKSGRSIKSNNSSSSNVPLSSSATTPTSTLNSTPAFSTSTIQQQQHQASHQPVKSATYTSRNDRRHNNHVGNGRNKYNNGSSSSSSSSSSSTSSSSKNNPSSSAPPTPTEYTHHYRSPFSIVQYPPPTNSKAKQGPINEVLLPLSSTTTKADKVQVPPPFSSSNNTNSALAKGPTAIPAPALTPAEPLLSMPPPQALLNHMSIISPVATTAAAPNTVLPFAVPLPLVIPPTVPQQSQQLQQIPPNSQVLVEVGGDTAGASQFVHLEDMNIGLNARPKMSCYNCGAQTHYGPECKENTLEEMTKYAYRINFNPDGGDSKESE